MKVWAVQTTVKEALGYSEDGFTGIVNYMIAIG